MKRKYLWVAAIVTSVVLLAAIIGVHTEGRQKTPSDPRPAPQVQEPVQPQPPIEQKPIEPVQPVEQPKPKPKPQPVSSNTVIMLINTTRAEFDLNAVTEAGALDSSAAAKCQDMVSKNYFAHSDPSGASTWDSFISGYASKGEILAKGFTNDHAQHQAWLNSPTHKAVIVMAVYRYIGQAKCTYPDGNNLTVVHFGG